jgi:hypothetical protein
MNNIIVCLYIGCRDRNNTNGFRIGKKKLNILGKSDVREMVLYMMIIDC